MLIAILLLIFCAGCRNKQLDNDEPNPSTQISGNPETFKALFESCILSGSVIDFSSSGCTISPTMYEDGLAYEAVSGNENQVKHVIVNYSESCTFQIVQVSLSTGLMTYEDTNTDNVKKQTRLFIAGKYDGQSILRAEQVYIYRMVE